MQRLNRLSQIRGEWEVMKRFVALMALVMGTSVLMLTPAGAQPAVVFEQLPDSFGGLFADSHCDGVPSGGCFGVTEQSTADDFTLTEASRIIEIQLWGEYFPSGAATGDTFAILFHEDAGGSPGTVVYQALGLLPTSRQATGRTVSGLPEYSYTIVLPSPAVLPAGVGWLEVFNGTTQTTDVWNWGKSLGFGGNGHTSVTTPGTGWTNQRRDVSFRLLGESADTNPPEISGADDRTAETDSLTGVVVDEGYGVTATDDVDPSPDVICDPVSGSLFPLGGTTVTCTATDDAGNSANASFVVTVALIVDKDTFDEVVGVVEGFGLHSGIENSLVRKLSNAAKSLDSGDNDGACEKLGSFVDEVNALEDRRVNGVTGTQADELRSAVATIGAAIGC